MEQAFELVRFAHEFYGSLDLMQCTPGIPGDLAYLELAKTAITAEVRGVPVTACSRAHLVAMKRTADRTARPSRPGPTRKQGDD